MKQCGNRAKSTAVLCEEEGCLGHLLGIEDLGRMIVA
jgi:hypothetical protein